MSGTRSAFPTAPATEPRGPASAVIVAHGQPSAPELQEQRIRALAAAVSVEAALPVSGTTLAMPGGLDRAVRAARAGALIYPMFMADGWFVREALPRRLRKAGARDAVLVTPFGLDLAVHALAARRAADAAGDPASAAVLLAAHGSPSDPRPAAAARAAAREIARAGFRDVRLGFIDEAPFLADAARGIDRAICLPFFARRAGHVENDLPEALEAAGFTGAVLDPVGEDREAPSIIARAIRKAEACSPEPAR